MFGSLALALDVLEQILLHPCDDVARLVERLAVDEQTGNLALSSDGDERLLGIGVGRDVALGDGHAIVRQEALYLNAIWASGHNVQHEFVMSSHRSPIGWVLIEIPKAVAVYAWASDDSMAWTRNAVAPSPQGLS